MPSDTVERHDPAEWTSVQGQCLAFIHAYAPIHNLAPAERDMQQFFRVTALIVHDMLKLLARHGFIQRQPGVARSIQLLVPPEKLPILQRQK